jgi:hypothetical protein
MRLQALRYCRGIVRPEAKSPLRKTFLHKPKSLRIVHKTFNCSSSPIPEYKETAGKRIVFQYLLTDSCQSINAVSEINFLNSHQDAHLRSDLDHRLILQKVLLRVFRSGTPIPLRWILILAPFQASSSIRHSGTRDGVAGLSSINEGAGPWLTAATSSRFFRS